MPTLAAATGELAMGYGPYLAQTTLALLLVCALAALALRALRRRDAAARGALRVVARLPLEPRRTLYVIEAPGKLLLVGIGDGAMATLAELDPARLAELESATSAAPSTGAVTALLLRALGRRPGA